MQVIAEAEQQVVSAITATATEIPHTGQKNVTMDADITSSASAETGTKRKADDEAEPETHKKAKTGKCFEERGTGIYYDAIFTEEKPVQLKRYVIH